MTGDGRVAMGEQGLVGHWSRPITQVAGEVNDQVVDGDHPHEPTVAFHCG